MANPLVDARIEIPDDCPMRCQSHGDGGRVRFVLGGIRDALDVPLDVVFEPGALRRFVELAAETVAAPAVAGPDGPP